MHRRRVLLSLLAPWATVRAAAHIATASAVPPVTLPRDFGSHPDARIEWWYATGSLTGDAREWGFEVTFFRTMTGLAGDTRSRFAARELVFAHAAVTDLGARRLLYDQRLARSGFGIAEASTADTDVRLRDWSLVRAGLAGASRYRTAVRSVPNGFAFELEMVAPGAPLLQGSAGVSRKGPGMGAYSHYYSEPQLAVSGRLQVAGRVVAVQGRAWLDHEWSDTYLDPEAVGWDWLGMNLDDGGALTAFRIRRPDGTTHFAGGSARRPGDTVVRDFEPDAVTFTPRRVWHSARSGASYPVEWDLVTPVGRYRVRALLDDQELDSRASTGAIYWEGLSELLDEGGRRVGKGYLEMTGYAGRLKLT